MPHKNVHNLAKANLSEIQLQILDKGLNFCPTPDRLNPVEHREAVEDFIRKLKIKLYFYYEADDETQEDLDPNPNNPDNTFQRRHRPKSKWSPKDTQIPKEALESLLELRVKLLQAKPQKHFQNNLSTNEKRELGKLRRNRDIVIKKADKGSGVVIQSNLQYKQEIMKQLGNPIHYREINPTEHNIETVNAAIRELLKKYNQQIPQQTKELLIIENSRPANFYTLPKIHKNTVNPPGRPIMSANNHPTERISEYTDLLLQPYIKLIPSYIKDTNHLLEIIKDITLKPNQHLYTFDVTGLYTNIPHQEGTQAIKEFLEPKIGTLKAEMASDFAKVVLENNIFRFDGKDYIQTSGTAMGTRMAPAYANIFMHQFESKHLPDAPIQPIIWKRYIDDILTVLEGTPEEIENFNQWLNSKHDTIKFTHEGGQGGIPFLDTYLKKREDGKINVQPHVKKTDTKQYLCPTSCHPPHIYSSIVYSQTLRIRRICNNPLQLEKELKSLRGFFLNRNYQVATIETNMNKAKEKKRKETTTDNRGITALVITYHPALPNYNQIIHTHQQEHPELPYGKLLISYKKPKSLKNILTRATFGEQPQKIQVITQKENQETYTQHILMTCQRNHTHITEHYNTIQEAIENQAANPFHNQHQGCGEITYTTIEQTQVHKLKCTQCPLEVRFESIISNRNLLQQLHPAVETVKYSRRRANQEEAILCGEVKCLTCPQRMPTHTLTVENAHQISLSTFNCRATNIIYGIKCNHCHQNYVGYTTTRLKDRINNHRSTIKLHKDTAIAEHFNQENHKFTEATFYILEYSHNPKQLPVKEATWINLLHTIETGINRRDERLFIMNPNIIHNSAHFLHSENAEPYLITAPKTS